MPDDLLQVTPAYLLQMVEQQMARLTVEEQRLLEAASVVGVEFTAIAVAAGLDVDVVQVEEVCGELARREQFIQMQGASEWPDGSVSARFRFQQAFCRAVVYRRVTGARLVRLHRRIGECEEIAYGDRVGDIALTLAEHFERGRDFQRAVKYLRQAAEMTWLRGDYQDAERLLTKGLDLLLTLPRNDERSLLELELQVAMEEMVRKGRNSANGNGRTVLLSGLEKG